MAEPGRGRDGAEGMRCGRYQPELKGVSQESGNVETCVGVHVRTRAQSMRVRA